MKCIRFLDNVCTGPIGSIKMLPRDMCAEYTPNCCSSTCVRMQCNVCRAGNLLWGCLGKSETVGNYTQVRTMNEERIINYNIRYHAPP